MEKKFWIHLLLQLLYLVITSDFSAMFELPHTDLHNVIHFWLDLTTSKNQPQVHRGQNFEGLAQDGARWRKQLQTCSGGLPQLGMSECGSFHQLFDFSPTLTRTAFGLFRYQQFLSRSATTQ